MLDQSQLWTLIILLWFTAFVAGVFCGIWAALWRKPKRQQKIVPEVYAAMREASASPPPPLSAPPSERDDG